MQLLRIMPRPSLCPHLSLRRPLSALLIAASLCAGAARPSPGLAKVNPESPTRDRAERRVRALLQNSRRGPQAAGDLLALVQEIRDELSPTQGALLLKKLRDDRRVDPALRELARYEHLRLEEQSGALTPERATQGYRDLGYLSEFQVLGPFADGSKASMENALAPEINRSAASFRGKVRNTSLQWRSMAQGGLLPGAYLSLDDMLYPNTDAVAYLRIWVRIPGLRQTAPVSMQLGSGGAYKIWVNKQLQGEGGADRRPHRLQDEIELELRPGWNEILLKGNVQSGLWGYYLRLVKRNAQAIAGLEQREQAPANINDPGQGAPSFFPKNGAGGIARQLEKNAKSGKLKDLQALLEFQHRVRPFADNDSSLEALAERVDKLAPTAYSAFRWAQVSQGDGPRGERLALVLKRRNPRAQPEATAHTHARAHAQLALRKDDLGEHRAHRDHLSRAAKLWPEHPDLALMQVQELQDRGWEQSALQRLRALTKTHAASSSVRRALAHTLAAQGKFDEAFLTLYPLMEIYGDQASVVRDLIELHLDHGDQDKALQLGRRSLPARARPGALIFLARLEQASGHREEALALMNRAVRISPHHDGFHRERGEMLLRSGQSQAAIAAFEQSLALRPQQPDLRDLLVALGSDKSQDLFAQDGLSLKRAVPKIEEAKRAFPKADAVVLNHRQVVKVLDNGLREALDHRQIYIANDRGAKAQEVQGTVYDPDQSYVEVKRARVRRADGSIEELGVSKTYSMTAAGYRMYYDQRQLAVSFPGLKAGDVIDLAFLRRDIAQENYFGRYFGDLRPLRGEIAQLGSEIIYEAPRERKLYFNRKVESRTIGKGQSKTKRYRVEGPKVGPLYSQGNMPGWTDALPYLHVSSYARWNEVADWYWGLVREQLVADQAIKDAVRNTLDALGSQATIEEKVAALYHHVVKKTRYVGLEFGIHGYKPYRTTQIYERRFGDCKDKASLLKVMLREAGIDSNLVLVRTKDQGRLTQTPASLSAFNHAILYVPALKRFLDGTAEFSGYGELPSADHGASVLIVKDGKGGEFLKIPEEVPQDNRWSETLEVKLRADGSASASLDQSIQGNLVAAYRRAYEDSATQEQTLQRQLAGRMMGVQVKSLDPIDTALTKNLRIQAKLEIPRFAEGDRTEIKSFAALGRTSEIAKLRASSAKRRHRFARPTPLIQRRSMQYHLPQGARWDSLPKSENLRSKFGKLDFEVNTQGDKVQIELKLELPSGLLSVEEYTDYRRFLERVDKTLNQRLRFRVRG